MTYLAGVWPRGSADRLATARAEADEVFCAIVGESTSRYLRIHRQFHVLSLSKRSARFTIVMIENQFASGFVVSAVLEL